MHLHRPAPRLPLPVPAGVGRALSVLLVCLGLASVSLAAAGSSGSSDRAAAVVAAAKQQLGDTYTWGGNGPDSWDCSGLTSVLWREVGGVRDIPRTSRQQQAWAIPIPVEQAEAGDLVFYGDPVSHVALVERSDATKVGITITMVDASSSRNGVVRRKAWPSGVVRYGRVPRPGMLAVRPWTPPPAAKPPATEPGPVVVAPAPTLPLAAAPRSRSQSASTSAAHVVSTAAPLAGLPGVQRAPSSAVALRAASLARATLGNRTLTDVDLIRNVWRRAGGGALPATRSSLSAAAHRVPVADARVGDLIVYAAPAAHVGIYVGGGRMIDASRSLGKVVHRQVWAGSGVQVLRLRG